ERKLSLAEKLFANKTNPVWHRLSLLTIKDILEFSPDSKHIITWCQVRSPIDNYIHQHDDGCPHIEVDKFFYNVYVCYRFRLHSKFRHHIYKLNKVALGEVNSNTLFYLEANVTASRVLAI